MPSDRYVLNDAGEPVPEPDLLKWAEWMEGKFRRLARTRINDQVEVSTVFLGLDHDFTFQGPPVLWETMVFTNGQGGDMRRYASKEAALAGHQAMVKKCEATQ